MSSKDNWKEVWRRIEFEPQDMVVNSRLSKLQILKDANFDNGIRKVTIVTEVGFTGDDVIFSQLNYPKLHIKTQGSVKIVPRNDMASNSFYTLVIPAGENRIEIELKNVPIGIKTRG